MTDRAGIPRAPGSFPLIGHAPPLLRAPLPFLSSLASHGNLVEVKIGPIAALVVCDAQLTRQVLLNDKVFDKGGLLYDRVREGFGNGLALCPHASHRRQRRLIQPVFNRESLGHYADTMTETIYSTIDGWADGRTIDGIVSERDVIPSASRRITRPMSLMMLGWMPSVGSSRISSRGDAASARAIASCCC